MLSVRMEQSCMPSLWPFKISAANSISPCTICDVTNRSVEKCRGDNTHFPTFGISSVITPYTFLHYNLWNHKSWAVKWDSQSSLKNRRHLVPRNNGDRTREIVEAAEMTRDAHECVSTGIFFFNSEGTPFLGKFGRWWQIIVSGCYLLDAWAECALVCVDLGCLFFFFCGDGCIASLQEGILAKMN